MKEAINIIAGMHVIADPVQVSEFEDFKKAAIINLMRMDNDVKGLMLRLQKHHINTFRHNVMVANDVRYIAERLGEPADSVNDLFVAALLHDIGKLNIMDILLSASKDEESTMLEIKRRENPNDLKLMREGIVPIDVVSVRDFLKYKKRMDRGFKDKEYLIILCDLGVELDISLKDYLMTHQTHTREILEQTGIRREVIEYAASHHPEYFDSERKIAWQCYIIEIADRFNAMIHSEGMRAYSDRFNKVAALNVIIDSLRDRFSSGIIRTTARRKSDDALRVLGRRYVPYEIGHVLIPTAEGLIAGVSKRGIAKKSDIKKMADLLNDIETTFCIDRKIPGMIEPKIIQVLHGMETRLVEVARRKVA